MKLNIENAIERVYHKSNLEGEDVDILKVINSYKILKQFDNTEKEAIYNYVADRMGLSNKLQFTNSQAILLNKSIGYDYFDII